MIQVQKKKKAKFNLASSFDKFSLKIEKEEIDVFKFNYKLILKDIDKDSFEELSRIVNNIRYFEKSSLHKKSQNLAKQLFMRGFDLSILDFSIKDININKSKNLKGLSLNTNIKLAPNFIFDIDKVKPIELLDKLDINFLLKISKPMFVAISSENPILALTRGYAKESNASLVYDIKVKSSSLYVNDKKIR